MTGTLFIVATPIGNLADLSQRARDVLARVSFIAAEDTRHSARLLQEYAIATPMQPYHDHNEESCAARLLLELQGGKDVALISDAGTPLVSDPGYRLVRRAQQADIRVVPVPGACAAIAALSCSGLASDRFTFEGFLPAKSSARNKVLQTLQQEPRTMIFYEAPHRIEECLRDLCECFGSAREATLARELTKTYETILHGTLADLLARVVADSDQKKGEIVLVVAGAAGGSEETDEAARHIMSVLLEELPLKQASALCARISGRKKSELYDLGLNLQGKKD